MAKQRAIGLAVDTVGSYGREVIHGVMGFCHRNPHWVIAVEPRLWIYDAEPQPDLWNVDGLILQAYSQELIDRVRAAGITAVNVANMGVAPRPLPTIVPDDVAIGRMAAEYLLHQGFRNFGYCAHGVYEFSALRGRAYRERLAESGVQVSECDTAVGPLDPWLMAQSYPIAVFCCNDAWAHRTLSAARRCGLDVPGQVAVLGVDDDELLNTVGALPLSSIAIPAQKIGFEAARLLEAALDGTPPPMHTTLPPVAVVARATTDLSSIDDPEVAAALRFIKASVSRPLQVDDVLEHQSISRRSLERRFRAALGRSVAEEIRRAHIERAKQLLTNTTLSIEEVAAASGFTSSTLLGVVFRRHVGESPTTFRQRSAIVAAGRSAIRAS
jgi:LacI family transcriptional regulator